MDPNLTLAHITHNTAVVLLHQGIAYPPPEWQSTPIRLPTQSSAETCLAAAIEVATIAEHFLNNSGFLANHQFAFCLFVCGRMLLAHSSYLHVPLDSSFDSLVDSLKLISVRWSGRTVSARTGSRNIDLASKFASRLSEARDLGPTTFDIRQAAYSEDGQGASGSGASKRGVARNGVMSTSANNFATPSGDIPATVSWDGGDTAVHLPSETTPDSISLAFPPLPQAFQAPSASQTHDHSPMGSVNDFYGFQEAPHTADPLLLTEGSRGIQGFEDISSYLGSTFLPDQRISMYSQLGSVGRQYPWHTKN